MDHKNIEKNQTLYQKEWLAMREVLKDKLIYSTRIEYCGKPGYELSNSGNDPVSALADAIFYVHHPELAGHKIKPSQTSLKEEWNAIYKSFEWEEDSPVICLSDM
jgi:hypothetical protein